MITRERAREILRTYYGTRKPVVAVPMSVRLEVRPVETPDQKSLLTLLMEAAEDNWDWRSHSVYERQQHFAALI